MVADFEGKLESFVSGLQAKMSEHYAKNFPQLVEAGLVDHVEIERGKRYVRIVKKGPGSHSAYAFIDTKEGPSCGAVLKADGYTRPAKHARGNIFADDNGLNCCGPYSVAYLR